MQLNLKSHFSSSHSISPILILWTFNDLLRKEKETKNTFKRLGKV